MNEPNPLLAQRFAARLLNLWVVFCVLALIQAATGLTPPPAWPAWILYEGLCILFGGLSLGRFLLRLRLRAKPQPQPPLWWSPRPQNPLPSKSRLLGRELLLWLLLPGVILSLPFGPPWHDRLTGVRPYQAP